MELDHSLTGPLRCWRNQGYAGRDTLRQRLDPFNDEA
jgi:hypothetical protein